MNWEVFKLLSQKYKRTISKCLTGSLSGVLLVSLLFLPGCKRANTTSSSDTVSYLYEDASGNALTSGASNASKAASGTASAGSGANGTAANSNGGNGGGQIAPNNFAALKGKTITIAASGTFLTGDAKSTNITQQNSAKMLSSLESKYGFKVQCKQYDVMDIVNKAQTAIMAGSQFADIIQTFTHRAYYFMDGKLFKDLNTVPTMNLSDSNVWVQNMLSQTKVYGKNLFTYMSIEDPNNTGDCLLFNKRILSEVGMTSDQLYQMVKNKQWTFAEMQNLSGKAVKELDGKAGMTKGDQYGFCGEDIIGTVSFDVFVADGGQSVERTNDGGFTNIMNTTKNVSALSTMQSWLLKDRSVYPASAAWTEDDALFNSGRCLFMTTSNYSTPGTSFKDSWGVVPFPMPVAGGSYRSQLAWNTPIIGLASNISSTDASVAGLYLNLYLNAVKPYYDSDFQKNLAKIADDKANILAMYSLVKQSGYMDGMEWGPSKGRDLINQLMGNVSLSPSTVVQSRNSEFSQYTNELMQNIKSTK